MAIKTFYQHTEQTPVMGLIREIETLCEPNDLNFSMWQNNTTSQNTTWTFAVHYTPRAEFSAKQAGLVAMESYDGGAIHGKTERSKCYKTLEIIKNKLLFHLS